MPQHKLANMVKQGSTSTGATTVVLSIPAARPYRNFEEAGINNGDTTEVMVANLSRTNQWQRGVYEFNNNVLTLVAVLSSSNDDEVVNFSSGTKAVYIADGAERVVEANLLPGGGGSYPREATVRIGTDSRSYRGGWSVGVEGWVDHTSFQGYSNSAGAGHRIIRRNGSYDYTKRWNWTAAFITSQIADLRGGPVYASFYPRRVAEMTDAMTFEILMSREPLQPIRNDLGTFVSGNTVIASTTIPLLPLVVPPRSEPYYISGMVDPDALGLAFRISGTWATSVASADAFVTGLSFGRGHVPALVPMSTEIQRLAEASLFNPSTYPRGVPPGQPNTLGGSLLATVQTMGGSDLGAPFNFRYSTFLTPTVRCYSPISGDIGCCYNESTGVDNVPVTLYENSNGGVSAWFARTNLVAAGNRVRMHIEAEVRF